MKPGLVKFDLSKLKKFAKGLSSGLGVDVGIMGARNYKGEQTKIEREDEPTLNNPTLGFFHELGHGVPMRSFLRMPLAVKSNQIINETIAAGALKKLADGRMRDVLADLGIACEKAIGEAFDTAGFNSWDEKKDGTPSHLVDTGQLRRSIASQVVSL